MKNGRIKIGFIVSLETEMKIFRSFLVSIVLIFSASPAWAAFCAQWSEPKSLGNLPKNPLGEASGMVASKAYPERVYWINDSGDKGFIYHTSPDGKNLAKIKIKDYKAQDSEALSMTECPEGTCLAIGDIGDNNAKRKSIEIVFVLEKADFGKEVPVIRRLKLQYPDGAHDAEALGFLPNGDMLIVTKEIQYWKLSTKPAVVYTLDKKKWQSAGDEAVTLEKIGELPLELWLPENGLLSHVVTDMAISTRRQVAILLTYGQAIEIQLGKFSDLSQSATWKINLDFAVVPLQSLSQQESITYMPDSDRILWSSEYVPPDAPIFSMTCNRALP